MPLGVFVPARAEDLALSFASGFDSAAQGAVPFRNGSSRWAALAAGTSGQVLTSGGAGANPSWTTPSTGVTAHSALTGLTSGDDHTQYIFKTPTANSRNVIKGSSDSIQPLRIQQFSGTQSAELLRLENSSGSQLAAFNKDGWLGLMAGAPQAKLDTSGALISGQNVNAASPAEGLFLTYNSGTKLALCYGYDYALNNPVDVAFRGKSYSFDVYIAGSPNSGLFVDTSLNTGFNLNTGIAAQAHVKNRIASQPALILQAHASQSVALAQHRLISSTSAVREAYEVDSVWATSTDASRKARVIHRVYDTAAREGFRIEADGSNAMIGFLGASASARETVTGSRGGNAALADLLTKLAAKGLITDGTSA